MSLNWLMRCECCIDGSVGDLNDKICIDASVGDMNVVCERCM